MENEIPELKLRRAAGTLAVCGQSVLCLSAWGILKMLHNLLFSTEYAAFREGLTQQGAFSRILNVVLIYLAITASDWFYFYVGFSAIAEAHGKHKSFFYTAVAFALMLAMVWSIGRNLANWWNAKAEFSYLGNVAVNAISLLVTADLWKNAIDLRRFRKQLRNNEAGTENAA